MKTNDVKSLIKTTIIHHFKYCSVDRYGQTPAVLNANEMFPGILNQVIDYCREGTPLKFSTYGWKYGTYLGFTITDPELKRECQVSLKSNPNYLEAMRSW